MDLRIWKQSKKKRFSYFRRRPEETSLYRIVYHFRQELEYVWDERYREHFGCLRRCVLEAFDRYLSCGILRHGCARAWCENCNHSKLIAFSCKRRGLCPSCDTKRAHLFAEHLNENILLPHPQRHIVFSIPKRLRVYFRYERSLTKYLYSAAWNAWRMFTGCDDSDRQTGMIQALHSAGDLLNFHPHIHSIALSGSIDHQGNFIPLELSNTKELETLFADFLFQALLGEELLTQETIDSMKTWEHSGFHVFVGEPVIPDDTEQLLFLSRYLKRNPVALERLAILENGPEPMLRVIKSTDQPEIFQDFSPLDFLAQLTQHVPDTWEQTTRYFGTYSARTRGAQKTKQQNSSIVLAPQDDQEETRPTSAHWARLIKKIYEVDPLSCDKCSGPMKIIAFLQRQSEIKNICSNLGIEDYRAPPKLRISKTQQLIPIFNDLQFSHFDS